MDAALIDYVIHLKFFGAGVFLGTKVFFFFVFVFGHEVAT
jgi:hypothetical protein